MQQRKSKIFFEWAYLIRGFLTKRSLFFVYTISILFFFGFLNHNFASPSNKSIYIDSLYSLLSKKSNVYDKYETLNQICSYWRKNDFDSALVYCNLNADMAKSLGLKKDYLELRLVVGHIHQGAGNFADAADNYIYALNDYILLDDSVKIALAYNHVGLSYYHDGNLDKALNCFIKSVSIAQSIGDPQPIANYANNLAVIYRRLNDIDKALYYHNLSLNLYQQVNDQAGVANVLNNMAIIFYQKQDVNNAISLFQKAAEVRKSIGDNRELGNTYFNIGFMYNEISDHEAASHYLLQSLNIAKKLGALPLQRLNYNLLTNIYKNNNDFKKALDYYSLFLEVNDSISKLNQDSKMQEIIAAHEAKQNKLQLNLLTKKNEATKVSLSKTRYIFFITFLIFAAFISLLVIIILSINRKAKTNKLLNEQNIAIVNNREQLQRKKEAMSLLNKELKEKLNEVNKQNKLLAKKTLEIESSLKIAEIKKSELEGSMRYAAKLQNTLKYTFDNNKKKVKDFYIYPPKNKEFLSDSSFWVYEYDKYLFISVFDAPQKSIGGAFWCVMLNTLLTKLITEQKIIDPGQISKEAINSMVSIFKPIDFSKHANNIDCKFVLARIDIDVMEMDVFSLNLPIIIYNNNGLLKNFENPDNSLLENGYITNIALSSNDRIWFLNSNTLKKYTEDQNKGNNYWDNFLSDSSSSLENAISKIINKDEYIAENINNYLFIGTCIC